MGVRLGSGFEISTLAEAFTIGMVVPCCTILNSRFLGIGCFELVNNDTAQDFYLHMVMPSCG